MVNSALKQLAQKAKKRLSSAGKTIDKNEKTTKAYLTQATYAIVASKQRIEEDPLFEKVKKIIERGDCLSPLQELTNQKEFNSLNSREKERYILEISKRYNEIRDFLVATQK